MNIVILSTSPRKNSNTLRFSTYLQNQLIEKGHQASVVDFHNFDIPSYGRGELLKNALTPFQEQLIAAWDNASLIIMATPEYNWTVNGDLLNALHQFSLKDFAHLFNNKTFAMAGVSAGRGGKIPCIELTTVVNKIINFANQYSIVSPRIYESHETHKNLNEQAQSTGNEVYEKTVNDYLDYTLTIATRWNSDKN